MAQLTAMVAQVLESNKEMSRRLATIELRTRGGDSSTIWDHPRRSTDNDSKSGITVRRVVSDSDLEVTSGESPNMEGSYAFEDDLRASRPYTRVFRRQHRWSTNSSAFHTLDSSCLSGLSLADVSNISVMCLPLTMQQLWNPAHYAFATPGPVPPIKDAPGPSASGVRRPIMLSAPQNAWRKSRLSSFLNLQPLHESRVPRSQRIMPRTRQPTPGHNKILLLGEIPLPLAYAHTLLSGSA